jgi:hypothetical protein
MTHRSTILPLLALAAACAVWPAPARAGGSLPINVAVGVYQPSTTNISYPNSSASYTQSDGLSAEASFGPIFETGVQVSALLLQQRDNVATQAVLPGEPSSNFTITQVPLLIESTGAQLGPVRLGGGLGYDFVHPSTGGGSTNSGVVGDTFIDVGLGSTAGLEGKYIFGGQAGLGGFFLGVSAKL